jgi:DNA-binding response OmpR family regulator
MLVHAKEAPRTRLLVVEDDRDLNEFIGRAARERGCKVTSAYTGEDALEVLRESSIDWLLTDIRLPGSISGWLVGSEFGLSHPLRPVIYISGVEPDSSQRRVGNSLFLYKPVETADLIILFERLGIRAERARALP